MNINPLYDRVVIKRSKEDKVALGGIVHPDSATEKPVKGEVVSVGKGKILDNGVVYPLEVKIGDKVLFGKYAGNEIKISDENLLVMRESDIMAVFEA
jgi:chaperonin GroES